MIKQNQAKTSAIASVTQETPWGKRELAAYLGVSVSAVDKMIAQGTAPPGFRVGWLWRWWPSVVREWTEAGGTSQRQQA
jgi:predicted DNA-binding transcriptional regulator AlpA